MISLTNIRGVTLTSLKQRIFTIIGLGTKGDTRTPNESAPFGYDGSPVQKMVAVHANTASIGGSVIIGYINVNQLAQRGEVRIYSTDSNGNEVSRIWQHNNGDIELGGTGAAGSNVNHATQWEGANNALITYFNDLNTQIGIGISSVGGTYTPPTNPFDFSPAKLTKIKTQ